MGLLAELRQAAVGARRAIVALMTRFGHERRPGAPGGLRPRGRTAGRRPGVRARRAAGRFAVTNSMEEAFDGADIVYPKSWAPAAVMKERTALLRVGPGVEARRPRTGTRSRTTRSSQHWECDDGQDGA